MTAKQVMGTILIVDDTPANLALLSDMLKAEGYSVRPAPSGRLALQAAQNNPPDLILLDINMPEMDGFEVCRRLKKDDKLKPIPVLFISALTDTADKVEAFKAGGVDYITKPFQAEEVLARVDTHLQIMRYQAALTEKSIALQKTLDDLRTAQNSLVQAEKMASLGVLTAGIAHEINNPINFVKTSAYALKQDIEDIHRLLKAYETCSCNCPDHAVNAGLSAIKSDISYDELMGELPALVSHITMGVERTEAVVNSLRTYSRPDDDKKTPTDISELIDSTLLLLENRYKNRADIQKVFGDLPPVPMQPGRLAQVLINVIGNAFDALGESPQNAPPAIKIQTDTETQGKMDYAVVRVTDNGPGISDAVRDKIFDPFFTTKAVGKGIGLGMYISYGIIREHGGRIAIDSSEDNGTTVSIFLPIEREA